MKNIRAYQCVRERPPMQAARSVCLVLNEEHAKHTLRAFLRGQGADALAVPISDTEVTTLLATPDPAQIGTLEPQDT